MSAETVGMHMRPVVTLDDLAAMITADPHGHRYEISPEGALSVMPAPDSEHAAIASRLLVWLATGGRPQVVDRDADQSVTLHHLGQTGEYEVTTKMPLAWLLNTGPGDHLR